MKLQPILNNLQSKLGIAALNPMQQVMAQTDSRNILLLAPTGSGKTAAFGLYLFRRLDRSDTGLQAVVMAPSRELVLQIHEVLRSMACDGVKITPLYGGHAVMDEVRSLSVVPHVVVATPGRLLDHIKRGNLLVDDVKQLVIDEYDKLLELGFSDEMTRIVRRMKRVHSIAMTSATRLEQLPEFMPPADIDTLDYTTVTQSPRHRVQVVQVESPERDKLPILVELIKSLPNRRTIVFVNHRESADRVHGTLLGEGFPAGLYHGGLEQRERQLALDMFDNGTTPLLVATDLAARGLDIDDIESVIHYHMPVDAEAWIHRNGRTARQDATGTIYVITHEDENLPECITFDRSMVPSGHSDEPLHSEMATLYINAGRREKISRGDIVGFLINRGGLTVGDIGKIKVNDHSSIVAVSRNKATGLIKAVAPHKLKNTRVKVSKVDINHKKC